MPNVVQFTAPKRPLGISPLRVEIRINDAFLGTVRISKGKIEWRLPGQQSGYWLSWQEFDSLMRQHGKGP